MRLGDELTRTSSLDLDKVPDKLHCAACHRFLFNAYKPTCCEQYICEPCESNVITPRQSLTDTGFTGAQGSCPICDHKPFSEEICKPNKAMRGTAKAYLRTVEKKVDDRSKAPSTEPPRAQTPERKDQMNGDVAVDGNRPDDAQSPPPLEQGHEMKGITVDERRPSLEVRIRPSFTPSLADPVPQAADESQKPTSADSTTDAADDEVEIQVEPSSPEEQETPKVMNVDVGTMEPTSGANLHEGGAATNPQDHSDAIAPGMDGANFANMMNMGFNTMDYNQMMQMMAATSGMNGFNPMMGEFWCRLSSPPAGADVHRNADGDEPDVSWHVWRRIWRPEWRHEWYERHEHGHELQPRPGDVRRLEWPKQHYVAE